MPIKQMNPKDQNEQSKKQLVLLLLFLIILSGLNTPLTKDIIDVVPPILNIGLRFLIAFLVMFLLRPKKILQEANRKALWRIALISLFMGGGYILWSVSLQFTTGTNATFFSCTSVMFIPFLAKAMNHTPYSGRILAGVFLTVAGMFLLVSNGSRFAPNPGDLLALAAAVFFAFQVVLTGRYVVRMDPFLLAAYQFLFVGTLGVGLSFAFGERIQWQAVGWAEGAALLYAGVLITAAMFYAQTIAQKKLSENTIGILYALLPLFAAVFSWMILGESLSPVGIAGGALMVAGVVAASLKC